MHVNNSGAQGILNIGIYFCVQTNIHNFNKIENCPYCSMSRQLTVETPKESNKIKKHTKVNKLFNFVSGIEYQELNIYIPV